MGALAVQDTRLPYAAFANHVSGDISDTNLVIRDAVRKAHPDRLVTVIDKGECDLRGWANAGRAVLAEVGDIESTLKRREYSPSKSRLDPDKGTLKDIVTFGKYTLDYEGISFDFYLAEWVYNMWGSTKTYQYLLAPSDPINGENSATVVDRVITHASQWTAELHDEIYVFDQGVWEKDAQLWSDVQRASWDDIILDPVLKQTITADVNNFFDRRALYNTYGVPWKRGVILHGVPGCGKTATIKALMNTLAKRQPQPVESLYVKTLDECRNVPSACVGEIFRLARARAPCLLIFEDIDSLVVDKVRSYFLNEVDGLGSNDGILIIASTNHLERLDPGISKRPSRFDRKYRYAPPNEKERIMYCDYWKKKLEANGNIVFDDSVSAAVASLTDGFTFAYLKELFVQSLFNLIEINNNEGNEISRETVIDGAGNSETANDINNPDTVLNIEHLKNNVLWQVLSTNIKFLRQAIADGETETAEKEKNKAEKKEKKENEKQDGLEENGTAPPEGDDEKE